MLNRLIEVATPQIFEMNQKLFNYAINKIVIPRVNRILTTFAIVQEPSPMEPRYPYEYAKDDNMYLEEVDDEAKVKYLKQNPIKYPKEQRVINKLFNDKFYSFPTLIKSRDEKETQICKIICTVFSCGSDKRSFFC
ncbi:CLUMA_CG005506, isoform A [Clunio marinus]|uniref:CLUMA_CG005506, isoform A n=1 Tax=Clunio marinus TaxID=568069 RepID=A0A1J1HZB4_9DIPT|nr:CLUMA_CG005506, isoform A [Clunio marinus]